jgi:hypothetical protein
MKKKYLTYAGIVSAVILAGMFIAIILSSFPTPYLPPGITFDPITDTSIDDNNMMNLTGMTTLPGDTLLFLKINADPRSLSQGNATETPQVFCNPYITAAAGKNKPWKGFCDISRLPPADYTLSLMTFTVTDNLTIIYSDPIATQHFTLMDQSAGTGTIRKKTRVAPSFIRINPADQEPAAEPGNISGITDLAPGTPLLWSIHPVTGGTGNSTPEFGGTTRVIPGTAGINRWSAGPGTGALEPATYQFTITGNPIGNATPATTVSALLEFDVPPLSATPPNTTGIQQFTPEVITIDSLPDIRTNGKYTVSGTTTVPAGEQLRFLIQPASFTTDFNFTYDPQDKRQMPHLATAGGGTNVVNGRNGYNLWSFDFDTYGFDPGRYEVNISKNIIDPVTSDIVPGTLYTAKPFTMAG